MICTSCVVRGRHRVLRRETEREDTVDDSPIVFVLTDQCFPPVLPPESTGECVKILRIEDGGVMELLNAFLETTKGFVIPAGTVVVVFSATRLARVGTEAYASEFADAKYRLSKIMGNGVEMLHGFPILYTGTKNMALVKGILDLEHWVGTVSKGRDIAVTRKHCVKLTIGNTLDAVSVDGCSGLLPAPTADQPAGSLPAPVFFRTRLVLPSLKSPEKWVFESPHYINVPREIDPISENDERNILEQFVQEINTQFMTDLATELSVDRETAEDEGEQQDVLSGKRVIVIGASHGARIALAMEDLGAVVVDLSCPGWRITTDNVSSMCQQLSTVLAESYDGETMIVYQLFDNNFYMVCDEDGVRSLPAKGTDNKYHVQGRLVTADRDEVRRLFTEVLPLLRAGLDSSKFLISPLMRYIGKSCCSNPMHIVNRQEKNYVQNIAVKLGEFKGSLNGLAFTRRLRNFAVICPNELLGCQEDSQKAAAMLAQYWGNNPDPVHMSAEGYADLSKRILERMIETDLRRPTGQPGCSKPNITDWASKMSDWVLKNDSAVHRRDTAEAVGGGRGNFRGRWKGGWRGRGRGKFLKPKPY
jgi:hypothetical protein